VILSSALVVGGTPIPDTLQAEGVIAAIQHTKLPAMLKHLFETDTALFVETIQRVTLVVLPHFRRVIVPAVVAITAVASLIVLTRSEPVWVLKEEVNYLIIIRHILKLLLCDGCQTCFTLDQLLCVECLLVQFLLLIQEGVMLDDIVNIIHLRVIFRLNFGCRWSECLHLTMWHHQLLWEIDSFRDRSSKKRLR
jgi:hypothetical protein